jgi:hypothetical protein
VPRPTPSNQGSSNKGQRTAIESDADIEVDGGAEFLDYDEDEAEERAPQRPAAPAPAPVTATPASPQPTVPFEAVPFEPVPFEPVPFEPAPPMAPPPAAPVPFPLPQQVAPPVHAPLTPAQQPLPGDAGSPWSSRDVEPTASSAVPTPRLSLGMAVLITVATSVVVLAIGVWWVRRDSTIVLPTVPSQSVPAAPSSAPPAKPRVRRPPAVATAKASADTRTGADLPPNQGYLIVRFPKNEGNVYFFTTAHGPVNQKIAVPCGNAFVRIGKAESIGVKWLSQGKSAVVACQKVTEVKIEP